MVSVPRITRNRYISLLLTISLVLVFFLLLNNIQTVKISKIIEAPVIASYSEKSPGAYIKYVHPNPSNTSYCKLNYGLPSRLIYEQSDLSGSPELGENSPFYVLYNVIEGSLADNQPGVTYATHTTENFVVYVAEIVRYWEGPISVAAYLPDGDPRSILEQFLDFCYCIPQMSRLSLHLIFRTNVQPMDLYQGNVFVPPSNCDTEEFSKVDSETSLTSVEASNTTPSHATSLDDWYPINVCRNAARQAAYTEYIMVCDVELMPSEGLASRFIDMTESYKCTDSPCSKRVFVVPVFEVEASENAPRTKAQLLGLIRQEKAVYFQRLICTHCQKFPGLEQWKESDPGDIVKPLLDAKREGPYHRWEPIYIGTKMEPMYHERLSWEGFQDKMLQMLEMCLADYKLVILDGAFLAHWPGVKKIKSKDIESWRKPFKNMNQKHYNLLLKNLTSKYPPNPQCRVK